MEGQRQRAGGKRRRKRAKKARSATPVEPVLIAARRPDSPFLSTGVRRTAASARPRNVEAQAEPEDSPATADTPRASEEPTQVRRRMARIVRVSEDAEAQDNRALRLLHRLETSQGRLSITRAANDLLECEIALPRTQEIQIQLLEHEDENRARDAVFVMAELLQHEPPIQRPVLDQRLRRLEQSAEDPITRDAADALRRALRANHGA